jgi:putative transposase
VPQGNSTPDCASCLKRPIWILPEGIIADFAARAPKAIDRLEEGFDDAMAVMVLPQCLRKRLRTTNCVERLNEEIRRRERVIRIFPNDDSAIRLLGAALIERDEYRSQVSQHG